MTRHAEELRRWRFRRSAARDAQRASLLVPPIQQRIIPPPPGAMSRACRAALFSGAVFQRLLADGKPTSSLDIDTGHRAGSAGLVGELRVVATGRDFGDAQSL